MKLLTMILGLLCAVSAAHAGQKEIKCLAENIYYESQGESLAGKLAVAKVTLNRTKHPNYPNTICEVVYQRKQFSWTSNISAQAASKNISAWKESVSIATDAYYSGLKELNSFTAIYFHNTSITPNWARKKVPIAVIGRHKFYK